MARKKNFQWDTATQSQTDQQEKPSKSEKKRRALACQELGEKLTALSPSDLQELSLPEDLFLAISEYWSMTKHEAKRRQRQLIGKHMRELDPTLLETLEIALANSKKRT